MKHTLLYHIPAANTLPVPSVAGALVAVLALIIAAVVIVIVIVFALKRQVYTFLYIMLQLLYL